MGHNSNLSTARRKGEMVALAEPDVPDEMKIKKTQCASRVCVTSPHTKPLNTKTHAGRSEGGRAAVTSKETRSRRHMGHNSNLSTARRKGEMVALAEPDVPDEMKIKKTQLRHESSH